MQTTQGRPTETETAVRGDGADGHHDAHAAGQDEIDINVPEARPVWVGVAGALVVLLLVALLVIGLIPRHAQQKELAADAQAAVDAPVPVNVTKPRRAPRVVEITLPGSLRPWQEVSIYARTSGYLKKYYVDISQQVEKGQLMAEIDTPEVEQELRQSEAALLQAKAAAGKALADRDLARVTWQRYKPLVEQKHISIQEYDEKQAALTAAQATLESANANVVAAEANVQRLTETRQFQKVQAPFAGVITGRGYDVGALIVANTNTPDIRPMYKIAENDTVRAFINVPQSSALQIRKGMECTVTARERPGRVFKGAVLGTTNYLEPTNRSLLTQVKVPNEKEPDGTFSLLPGMYVQVSFAVNRDTPPLMIPAPALVTTAEGTQVAVADGGRATFRKVTIGQDYGSEIEIVDGLSGDEEIIANPGERITEGAAVATGRDEQKTGTASAPQPAEKAAAKVVNAASPR